MNDDRKLCHSRVRRRPFEKRRSHVTDSLVGCPLFVGENEIPPLIKHCRKKLYLANFPLFSITQ